MPAVARGRAAPDRQRLGQLQQVVDVGRPCRARLLDERAEHAVVARHRARVRGGRGRAGRRGPDLEHRDADPLVGADRERLAQPRAVAVGLHEQRDRPHARIAREVLDLVRRRQTASLPHEIAVCRRSPRRVASALTTRLPLWETSATCPGSGAASASPHIAAREWSEISPSQFGPQTGSECRARGLAQRVLERDARRRLAEPRGEDHGAAAPERARLLDDRRHARPPGSRPRPRPAPREIGQRRKARHAVDGRPARIDAPDLPSKPRRCRFEQRLRSRSPARSRAPPRQRPTREQRS